MWNRHYLPSYSNLKLNFHPLFQIDWPDTAWPDIRRYLIRNLHSNESNVFCLTELDAVFWGALYKDEKKMERLNLLSSGKGWIGIAHQVESKFQKMCQLGEIYNHIENCKVLFVLSEHASRFWKKEFPLLKVEVLHHPFPIREKKFRIKRLNKTRIRSLGSFERKYDVWKQLDSPYKKLRKRELPFEKFDKMLTRTIQFMDLKDASANNGVLECIRRHTPLLVNKHPAVQEYLGVDYPFYFESLEEANDKINNSELIVETHEYLKRMDKTFIDYETFLKKFKSALLS